MSDRQFVYFKKDGIPSDPVGLPVLMTTAKDRIKPGSGPLGLTQDGELVGRGDRKEVLGRLDRRLTNGDVGPTYRIRNAKGVVVFRCREVIPAIDVIDTNGNDKVDAVWSAVVAEFHGETFLGAYVCKHISGTSLMSQHSYANALDIGGPSMAFLNEVADWLFARRDEFSIETIIVGDRIWTRSGGWHAYTGDYHYHVHVDFTPHFSGACGPRG